MTTSSPASPTAESLRWIDVLNLTVQGRGWTDTEHPYDRLPARARPLVSDLVWNLSHDSAGMLVHFTTDATELRVQGRVRKPQLAMGHMPASGVSGVDLYLKAAGGWQWFISLRPENSPEISGIAFQGLPAARREFLLYLPLYNGTDALRLGVSPGARCTPVASARRPIVFYGTSIVQGACASRPGMAHVAQLRRRLEWPVINLGFSGNGKAEPEVAGLLGELDAQIFVIDCLPNLQADQIGRIEEFVRILRRRHGTTPIVLVESIHYPLGDASPAHRVRFEQSNAVLRDLHGRLSRMDANLHLVAGATLLGTDREATVDGVHPTDLGFVRMADQLEPVLRRLLPATANG